MIQGLLTWKCHICGDERPDENISVLTKPLVINGVPLLGGVQNIRYCNDRPECLKGARGKDFFAKGEK